MYVGLSVVSHVASYVDGLIAALVFIATFWMVSCLMRRPLLSSCGVVLSSDEQAPSKAAIITKPKAFMLVIFIFIIMYLC
jgi:hypothetical protein